MIAGSGLLPDLVLKSLPAGQEATVLTLPGCETWRFGGVRKIPIDLGNYVTVLRQLAGENCQRVVLAGAVKRPPDSAEHAPEIWDGDDSAIRALLKPVEALGIEVVSVQDLVPDLVAQPGVLTALEPEPQDQTDASRAARIVRALGRADVGQSAVVARGLCIAVETATGTDAMLRLAGQSLKSLFPQDQVRVGLFYKAPKIGQDLRVDCPVVGPATVTEVAAAGLRGMVVQAGGVLMLDRIEMARLADNRGVFIWVVPENFD